MDRVEPGQEFDVERLDCGDYRLRRSTRRNQGLIDSLLACPYKGFEPIPNSPITAELCNGTSRNIAGQPRRGYSGNPTFLRTVFYYARGLVRAAYVSDSNSMRIALLSLPAGILRAAEAFGVWKLNPGRSTLSANEQSVTLRIQPQPRAEVLTMDAVDVQASSTILYFDGKSRDFHDSTCSGTRLSRRVDSRTVEIVRECASDGQVRLIRRAVPPKLLIFEITGQQTGGRRTERRLVMEKQ